MKKIISLFLSTVMLLSITTVIDLSAYANTSGYYQFTISSGKATITKYTGAEEKIIIPSKLSGYEVTAIGQAAFSDADKTKTVVIPDTVTKIGIKAFCSSDYLSTVTIGKKVTVIDSEAFYCCNLSNVFLPASLNTVGSNAFMGNGAWYYEDGYLIGKGKKCHIYYEGNETQWSKIKFSTGNEPLTASSVEFNSSGVGNHIFGAPNIVQPSCEKQGYTIENCKVCNYENVYDYVNATGHNFGNNQAVCSMCGTENPNYIAPQPSTPTKPTNPTVPTQPTKPEMPTVPTQPAVTTPTGAKKVNGEWVAKKQKNTKIKKLTKAKKSFKATWSKVSGVKGYQIQYSTSKKFTKKTTKSVTIKKNKTTSKTVKKLKAKKKYYVRIRTYKNVKLNGKTVKVYSSWSKAKTVKIK